MTMMTSEPSPVSLVPPASPAQPGHFARPKLLPYHHHHHHHQIRHPPQHTPIIHHSSTSPSPCSSSSAATSASSSNVNKQQQQQHSLPHEPISRHSHQGNSSFGPSGHLVNASPGKTVNLVILPSSNESSLTSSLPTASTSPASSHPWLEPGVLKSNIHLPPCKSNINHGSPTMAVPKKSPISPPLSCSSSSSFHPSPPLISSKTGPGDVSDSYSFPITTHSSPYQCNDRFTASNLRSETRVRDSVDWSHLFGYPNELTSSTSSSLLSSTSSAVSSVSNENHHLVTSNNSNSSSNSNSNNKKPPTGDRPHLHALHRLRREIAKGLASSCRVLIRDNSNRSRPSLLALGRDFFCRFADREKIALSSFDFLDEYYRNPDGQTCLLSPSDFTVDQEISCIDYTYLGLSYLTPQSEKSANQFTLVDVPGEGEASNSTSPTPIVNECDHEDEESDDHPYPVVAVAGDVAPDGLQSGKSTQELNLVVSSLSSCDENEQQPQQQLQQQHELQFHQPQEREEEEKEKLKVQPQQHKSQEHLHQLDLQLQLRQEEHSLAELDKCDVEMESSFKRTTFNDERESEYTRQSTLEEPFVPYLLSHPNCVNPCEGQIGEVQDEEQVIFESSTLPSESISDEEQHTPKHLPSSNDSSGSESCDLSYATTRYHQIEYLPDGVTELADDLVCLLAEYNTGNESNDVSPLTNYCLTEVEHMFQGGEKQVKDVEELLLPYVSPPNSSQSPPNVVSVIEEEEERQHQKQIQVDDEVQVNVKKDDTFLDQCQGSDLCDLTASNGSDVKMASLPLDHQVSLSSSEKDEENFKIQQQQQQVLVLQRLQQQQSSSSSSQVVVDGQKDKGKERSAHYSCNKGKSRRAKHRQRRKQQVKAHVDVT